MERVIDNRIEVRCRVCNQRMFDYMSGNFLIEIKCGRCKTVNLLQGKLERAQGRAQIVPVNKAGKQRAKQFHIAHL